MANDPNDPSRRAAYWLELKAAWTKWLSGEPMPPLSAGARSYFEHLAHRHLCSALQSGGRMFERVPRPSGPDESWRIVFTCLVEKRRQAAVAILDDIFERSERRARDHTGDQSPSMTLASMIGWVEKQFELRVRDVARSYARELGTREGLKATTSGDAPASATPSDDGRTRTVFDQLSADTEEWGSETEKRELEEHGNRVGNGHFTGLRSAAKLGVFLRSLRMRRTIIISSEEPEVSAVAGVKKAVFAQLAKDAHDHLRPKLETLDEWADLDADPRRALGLAAVTALWDASEDWFWDGRWLDELPPRQKAIAQEVLAEAARDFTSLVQARMGEFFPENELTALFNQTNARLTGQAFATQNPQ